MTKKPRIQTNEGPPHKSVTIITQVVARPDSTYPLIIKPYKLDISQFSPTKVRDEMKFNITNVSEQDMTVTLVSAPEGIFDLELPDKVEAGKTAQGILKLRPEAIETSFEKSFTIELNDGNNSRFTIPVKRTRRTPGEPAKKAESGHGH
jgi:hypothetical protein